MGVRRCRKRVQAKEEGDASSFSRTHVVCRWVPSGIGRGTLSRGVRRSGAHQER